MPWLHLIFEAWEDYKAAREREALARAEREAVEQAEREQLERTALDAARLLDDIVAGEDADNGSGKKKKRGKKKHKE